MKWNRIRLNSCIHYIRFRKEETSKLYSININWYQTGNVCWYGAATSAAYVRIHIHMSAHTSAVHVCIGLSGQRHTHNVKWRTHVWRCSMLMLVWMSHDNSVPTCYMEILWWYATRVVRPIMIIHNVFFVIVLSANEVCICELFTSMTFFYDTLGP